MGRPKPTREQTALAQVEEAYLNEALTLHEYENEKKRIYQGTSRFLPAEKQGLIEALLDGQVWAIKRAIIIGIVAFVVLALVSGALELAMSGGMEYDD